MPWRCSRVTMKGGASLRRPSPRASRTRETDRASHDGGTGIPSASRAVTRCELIAPPSQPSSGAGDFPELVGLDDVALLEVLEVAEADAAFESLLHLAGVVLEPLERGDCAVPDDDAVAQETDPRAACDHAVLHVAAGHPADTRDREHLTDLGVARDDLLELGLEHADERLLHVLEHLVDDFVEAQVDALGLGELASAAVGSHVEADDGGIRHRCAVHVGLGDAAAAPVHE